MFAFVFFGFLSQLALLGFFAALVRRAAVATLLGRLVYGLGFAGALLAAALMIDGQPRSLILGPALYAAWAAFGTYVDLLRPVQWRQPPVWLILVPYASLLTAALIALWVPLWYEDRALWIAFGILYALHTALNIWTHVRSGRG